MLPVKSWGHSDNVCYVCHMFRSSTFDWITNPQFSCFIGLALVGTSWPTCSWIFHRVSSYIIPQFFFLPPTPPHQNQCPLPMGCPPLKINAPPPPTLKSEASWNIEKKPEKLGTDINTCVSIIKQHWRKMAEIPQEHDFLTWGI